MIDRTKRLAVVERVADRLMADGAIAVVLVGSVVRGDDHEHSDLDIVAIGDGPAYELVVVDEELVSVSYRTPDAVRARFDDPRHAGGVVPSWRAAKLVRDPHGVGAALQDDARAWTWDSITTEVDRWVAEQVTGYAEEVHKLVAHLDDRPLVAGVQRALVAVYAPVIVAVDRRMLYDSEDNIPELVNIALGEEWRTMHEHAIGATMTDHVTGCVAALGLYELTAAATERLLDVREAEVVGRARARAREVTG